MIYLIAAQVARIAVVWTANRVARQILKSIALASVAMYLVERAKKQQIIDERRGLPANK